MSAVSVHDLVPRRLGDLSKLNYSFTSTSDNRVLIIGFMGKFGRGSQGNDDARSMNAVVHAGIAAFDPEAIVLDLREMAYQWGDMITLPIGVASNHAATVMVTSDLCREGMTSLVRDEMCANPGAWLTENLDTAIDRVLARVNVREYIHEIRQEDIALFDPIYGLRLSIKAGSGRSWMEQPDGDPVSAHLSITCDGDTLAPDTRLHSYTGFVRWNDLLRFANQLDELAQQSEGGVDLDAAPGFVLTLRLDDTGRLQAEAQWATGHHLKIMTNVRTTWHDGIRADLPRLAEQIRSAVRSRRSKA